ncbi:MAG: hypothetical protein WBS22_12450, partial [Methylocystis sp.]
MLSDSDRDEPFVVPHDKKLGEDAGASTVGAKPFELIERVVTGLHKLVDLIPNSRAAKFLSAYVDNAVLETMALARSTNLIRRKDQPYPMVFIIAAEEDWDIARQISLLLEIEGYVTFSAFKNFKSNSISQQTYFQNHFHDAELILTLLTPAFENSVY